jgi:hypothetical protein
MEETIWKTNVWEDINMDLIEVGWVAMVWVNLAQDRD